MTCSVVIIDTKVIVAGLLTANDASPVPRNLDGMLEDAFSFVVSEVLLDEYRTVLVRPRLHGMSIAEVHAILTGLVQHAIVWSVPLLAALPAPDPGNQLLCDLLAVRAELPLLKRRMPPAGNGSETGPPSLRHGALDPGLSHH